MPYYVHPVGAESPEDSARESFPTVALARAAKRTGETVTYVPSTQELVEWQRRESERFFDGTYVLVPWTDYSYYEGEHRLRHFAHVSMKFAGQVAFTKSSEHGMRDRQTVMRPGRYLEEYFSCVDLECRQAWIGAVSAFKTKLGFARTPDEIERVYVGGPSSCMSHKAGEYESSEHPVRVYGDSDLAIAYIGDMDKAAGRAIVWPDKKIYGRIYGNDAVMVALLAEAGYQEAGNWNDWLGAKIRRIKDSDDRYVMPYLDIASQVHPDRKHPKWFVIGKGDDCLSAQHTEGLTPPRHICERCDNECDDDDDYCQECLDTSEICPSCDSRNWDDNSGGYCDYCNQYRCCCDVCDDNVHTDTTHYLELQEVTICDDCYEDTVECEVCGERFHESAYRYHDRRSHDDPMRSRVCLDCQRAGASICVNCDVVIKAGETCECAKTTDATGVEGEEVTSELIQGVTQSRQEELACAS